MHHSNLKVTFVPVSTWTNGSEFVNVGQCVNLESGICWLREINAAQMAMSRRTQVKLVHVIRDPKEMVVSSLVYHRYDARLHPPGAYEPWLNKSLSFFKPCSALHALLQESPGLTWYDRVRKSALAKALRDQAELTLTDTIQNMAGVYVSTHNLDNVLTIRLEDVVLNFDQVFLRLFTFIGLPHIQDALLYAALFRKSNSASPLRYHISDQTQKPVLRAMLASDVLVCKRIAFMQQLCDYDVMQCACDPA